MAAGAGFRNVVVHSYGAIDRSWAWATVERDVPSPREAVLGIVEVRKAYGRELSLMVGGE